MPVERARMRVVVVVVLSVTVALCPLATSAYWSGAGVSAGGVQQPIKFTPNVQELQLTAIAATPFPEQIVTTAQGPPHALISGNTMTIDGETYPIGDSFSDASQIPMGSIERSRFNEYGYSTILAVGAQDYRLLWTTEDGQRNYIILKADDTLFAGPDGFTAELTQLKEKEELTFDAMKIELGGLGAILAAEFAICPFTAAAGCVAAIVTGAGGLIGGFGLTMWRVVADWIPARNSVNDSFTQIEINRP